MPRRWSITRAGSRSVRRITAAACAGCSQPRSRCPRPNSTEPLGGTRSALAKCRHHQFGEVAKDLALKIRRRLDYRLLDTCCFHRADLRNQVFGLAHQAGAANRLGRDEAPLLGLHESAVAFVNLPEARALGQTVGVDAPQVVIPHVAEKGRNRLV